MFLIVFAQSSITPKPAKCAFYNPPVRKQLEANLDIVVAFDDFQYSMAKLKSPINQLTCIATISPN